MPGAVPPHAWVCQGCNRPYSTKDSVQRHWSDKGACPNGKNFPPLVVEVDHDGCVLPGQSVSWLSRAAPDSCRPPEPSTGSAPAGTSQVGTSLQASGDFHEMVVAISKALSNPGYALGPYTTVDLGSKFPSRWLLPNDEYLALLARSPDLILHFSSNNS